MNPGLANCRGPVHSCAVPDCAQCEAVEQVPKCHCTGWVFRGTHVPVGALFANLEEGATVEDFLRWFPGVKREHVLAVLDHAEHCPAAPVAETPAQA